MAGKAEPNTTVLVYIYSYVPMVLSAKTDDYGNFTIDLASSVLADGEHTAYVVLSDETGKVEKKSGPLSFFIREAQAVTRVDFLRPDFAVTEEPAALQTRWYLYGVAAHGAGRAGRGLGRTRSKKKAELIKSVGVWKCRQQKLGMPSFC